MKKTKQEKYEEAIRRNLDSELNVNISCFFNDDKFFIGKFNTYFKDVVRFKSEILTILKRRLGIRENDHRFDNELGDFMLKLHCEYQRRLKVDWNEFYRIK